MLKFENTAKVGDVIKAFDFQPMPGRDDSYLVGRVVAKGAIKHPTEGYYMFDGYTVFVLNSCSGSEKYDMNRIGDTAYVPFETDMIEYDERVSVVVTEEEVELLLAVENEEVIH